MPWVYLDDHIDEHDKTIDAGDAAFGFWVRLVAFCRRKQNGGRIPKGYERLRGQRSKIERLLKVGYLDDRGDHYQVHDYDVIYFKEDEERRRRSERAKKAADARWNARSNAQALPEQCDQQSPSNAGAMPRTRERAPDPTPHTPIDKSPPDNQVVAPNAGGGEIFDPTVLEAIERMAQVELEQAVGVRDPASWKRSKAKKLLAEQGRSMQELVVNDPSLTPSQLVGLRTNPGYRNAYENNRRRALEAS